ncbi:MAG: hypothetical protein VB131_07150 [Burkholderia gladioli]
MTKTNRQDGAPPPDLSDDESFGDAAFDLREPVTQYVPGECVGGRTQHVMEPEWQGRSFEYMRCRFCGHREPN